MLGPHLTGQRVRLAPITPEMLPTFVSWFADPDVTRFLTLRYPPTLDGERGWFENTAKSDTELVWAVFACNPDNPKNPESDKLIGTTGIHRIHWPNRRAITGNLIGEKSEWNKGYGTETVRLRTAWAFGEMGLEKLTTHVFMENGGSRRVLEKAGYKQYGIARRDEWRGGKWHDMWLADVLKDEWQAAQNAG